MTHPLTPLLIAAWQQGTPVPGARALELAPADHAEAYAVQSAVAQALNWFPDGPRIWKLGGPSGGSTAAPVAAQQLKHCPPGQVVQLLSSDAWHFTAVEVELVVRLGRPLLAGATLSEACAAIDRVYLGIEVCDARSPDWQTLPATVRLADQQLNRGFLLLDNPCEGWDDSLSTLAPEIDLNGKVLSRGPLQHPQGHPLAALPWLANLAAALYRQPLQAGTLIATGSWCGMPMLHSGDRFEVGLEPFGSFQIGLDGPVDTSPIRFQNNLSTALSTTTDRPTQE